MSMQRASLVRLALIALLVLVLELLCRLGVIDNLTMPPPSVILRDTVVLLAAGSMNAAIWKTAVNVVTAFGIATISGVCLGVALHGQRALRRGLEPLFATYYAIPVYAFYPLLIILFGLGDAPQILIGIMLAVVAMIMNTLNGLDRVSQALLKTARIHRLGAVDTALHVALPCAAPYLLTGVKLAVAYAFIGVIGAEFIMSNTGVGYEISFAYNNFDNATMYPLILLILIFSVVVNAVLSRWESTLMRRRGYR
jgi:NitT/TauT family transport system permease protein